MSPPPDAATIIRRLLRTVDRASLGTLDAEGAPYVSLVMLAVDHDASPLLLLSDLADHTRNFSRDARVSLLIDGTAGMATPLAGARATLMGRIAPAEAAHHRGRYLGRHPDATGYAGFKDFRFYRVAIERAHLVAGFGRIEWVPGEAVRFTLPDDPPLVRAEPGIVAHMNEDHADAIALYAERLLGLPAGDWLMTGIDPEGCDLRGPGGAARLWFDEPVGDAQAARIELVRLVRLARATPAAQADQ